MPRKKISATVAKEDAPPSQPSMTITITPEGNFEVEFVQFERFGPVVIERASQAAHRAWELKRVAAVQAQRAKEHQKTVESQAQQRQIDRAGPVVQFLVDQQEEQADAR